MAAAKHTPGPWTLAPADCFINDEVVPGGWTGVSADGWGDLAIVVTRMTDEAFDQPQGVANARLIAAAPDLLAFVAIIAKRDPVFAKGLDKQVIADARALVAKATGQ